MNMKTMLSTLLLLFSLGAFAQDDNLAQLDVRTSTVCDMCEKTIETELIYEKGVRSVEVDLAANIIHVGYDPRKTSPDQVRTAITKLGYYADDQPGDAKAFAKLPACCQKEGCGKPVEKH